MNSKLSVVAAGAAGAATAATSGAALAYYLDPLCGRARRRRARQRTAAALRRSTSRGERLTRVVASRAYGTVQRAAHPLPAQVVPDDRTLKQRVQTEVFGDPAVSKGPLVVDVLDGMVTLRGQLPSHGDIARVEDLALSVIGVRGVESLLHLPGVHPANKTEALKAS